MTDQDPLPTVSSEKNRPIESKIVNDTIKAARTVARAAQMDDIITVPIMGIEEHTEFFSGSIRQMLIAHIDQRADKIGLRLVHTFSSSLDFQVTDKRKH